MTAMTVLQGWADQRHRGEGEHHGGEGADGVEEQHDEVVEPARAEPGEHAKQHADAEGQAPMEIQRHLERDLPAVQHSARRGRDPSWSVPSRWLAEGPCRRSTMRRAMGSWGAITPASSALIS